MSRPSTGNYVYFVNDGKKNQSKLDNNISYDKLQKILQTLSKYAMKEKTPEFQELESLLQNSLNETENQDSEPKSENDEHLDQGSRIIRTPITPSRFTSSSGAGSAE